MMPFESTASIWSPKNCPPFSPIWPICPRILPSSRLRNQMWLLVRSEIYSSRCSLSGENITPPVEPPTTARRHLRRMGQFGNQFGGLLIVFADVADPVGDIPDVRESFAVHCNAVPL